MYRALWKRVIDTTISIVAMIVLSPILFVVALAIKFTSPGPILFKQQRLGLHGKEFTIYKFRSMAVGTERTGSGVYSEKDDPRVTKVGKFIRKTSIDELPQFFNVFIGNMSLVGTRPPTVDEVEKYERDQWRRISIKPGITGMWQVSGRSNVESFEDVVQMDVDYIDNWSIFEDIKIIFRTVLVILHRDGAY